MKKVVIICNKRNTKNERNSQIETEYDSEITIDSLINAISTQYITRLIEVDKKFNWIGKVISEKPDLVFNVSEGFYGPARESVFAAVLEQLEINYCGPDSTNLFICLNKNLFKSLLYDAMPEMIPMWSILENKKDIKKINFSFPFIIKPNAEGSSIAINTNSIVHNKKELISQLDWIEENYSGNIMVEQYVHGKDISIAYVEGIGSLGAVEICHSSELYDYLLKSIDDENIIIKPFNNQIVDKLKEIVEFISKKLDIKGYAKFDFRVSDNRIFLIEINAQVSFHPNGEFMESAYAKGYSFDDIILHILKNAFNIEKRHFSVGINNNLI